LAPSSASASVTFRSSAGTASAAVELLRPEAVVLTPSYAAYLVERAAELDVDLRGSNVHRVLVAGEPGGGEPAFRARLEEGWGARVTEAMGIGDIGAFLHAIDYEFPSWAKEYMGAVETTLGDAYSEPAADVRDYVASVKSPNA
jgi:phenylacetate-coenzyme A ligase PaaK-like adenylate-forming protein